MTSQTVIAPHVGNGVIELDLGSSGTQILDVPEFSYLTGEIVSGFNSPAWARHVIQAASRDLFNEKIGAKLIGDREVRARVGITSTDQWTEWTTYRISQSEMDLSRSNSSNDGYTFVLEMKDPLVIHLSDSRVKARQGTISDIVEQMTQDFKARAIEKTRGKYALVQSYETDLEFVQRLSTLAVNENGLGDFNFYVTGDTFHFHTRGWQASEVKTIQINYGKANAWTIVYEERLSECVDAGAGGVQSVVYDPLAARVTVETTQADKVRKLGDVIYKLDPSWTVPNPRHAGQNQVQSELDRAQVQYERARARVFQVKLCTTNVTKISLGDVVQLEFSSPNDPLGGQYIVAHRVIKKEGGSFDVIYTLVRGEMNKISKPQSAIHDGRQALATQSPDNVAKGLPLSVASVAASTATKISGGSSGNTVPILPP